MKFNYLVSSFLYFVSTSIVFSQQWSGSSEITGNLHRTGHVGIGVSSPGALLHTGDGNVYFNTSDPDNAGLRILFDKSTNNNGVDVDLTINSNSGSPIVDWNIRNWGGSYVFSRGSSTGKTRLFEINNYGDIFVPGGKITGKNAEYISLGETDNEINFYSGGIPKFSMTDDAYKFNEGNLHFNAYDPDNAGLRIYFDKTTNNNGADVDLTINTNSGSPIVDWNIRNWGGSYTFNRNTSDGKRNLFRIESSGNIVIPGGHAIIDGRILCEEVKVEVMDVPDYVFEKDYKLRSLEETKKYIGHNKHLPEIPSAKQMETEGIELGVMNMLLLKKIEELTLHLIQQSENAKARDQMLMQQALTIKELQKEIDQIRSQK